MDRFSTKNKLLWVLSLVFLVMLIGCTGHHDTDKTYTISGKVIDGEGIGLFGILLEITGSEESTVITDSQGQWSATVKGQVVIRPQQPGYYFAPLQQEIKGPLQNLLFTLKARILEEGDPTITLKVGGLPLGEMFLYQIEVLEITGLKDVAAYSLLSNKIDQGIVKDWFYASYGASLQEEVTLLLLDPQNRVLASLEVPYGHYTKTIDLILPQGPVLFEASSPHEPIMIFSTGDYLATAQLENRSYIQEDIPLQLLEFGGVFPEGYILINDIGIEFYYAFDDPLHFQELLTQKYEEVEYVYGDLHLYFSLPQLDPLTDAKTGEDLSEGEKREVLAGIIIFYDWENPEGRFLAKAHLSVEVKTEGTITIFQVMVHDVEGVEGAISFTILDPDHPPTPFGEAITGSTPQDSIPLYILDLEPLPTDYTISGVVVDEGGVGIESVVITFLGDFAPVETGEDGTWIKDGLSGVVLVTPEKDGFIFDPPYREVDGGDEGVNFLGIREGGSPGDRTSYMVGEVEFFMRLAPAATFPTGIDDRGETTVLQSFWVAETPVTYGLWYEVKMWALHQDYVFANLGREGSHGATGGEPSERRHEPVTTLNWYDNIVWLNALSQLLDFPPVYTIDGEIIKDATNIYHGDVEAEETKGFRLLTIYEWELAARYKGGDRSNGAIEYPAGSRIYWTPGSYASGATADYHDKDATMEAAWYLDNTDVDGTGNKTQDVGEKPLAGNSLGLFDMSGNVWEWCFTQVGPLRYARGGAWLGSAFDMQVGAYRGSIPAYAFDYRGIRFGQTH